MDVLVAVILSVTTGLISSVATVAAMRTDIAWIKDSVGHAHKRIDRLEDWQRERVA